MRECHVYVMSCEGRTKIGISNDVERRRRSIEMAVGAPVALHGSRRFPTKSSAGEAERHLHRQFVPDRLHGEWFSSSPAVAIEALGALPDTPEPTQRSSVPTLPDTTDEDDDAFIERVVRRLEEIARSGRRQLVGPC